MRTNWNEMWVIVTLQCLIWISFINFSACNQFTNCNSCISAAPQINFDCRWCGAIKRCSSGFDRHRQDWLEADCLTEVGFLKWNWTRFGQYDFPSATKFKYTVTPEIWTFWSVKFANMIDSQFFLIFMHANTAYL